MLLPYAGSAFWRLGGGLLLSTNVGGVMGEGVLEIGEW